MHDILGQFIRTRQTRFLYFKKDLQNKIYIPQSIAINIIIDKENQTGYHVEIVIS